jgi:hypothetical protein
MSRKLTTEERAALKETLKDAEGDEVALAKIAEMPEPDRAMAERVHAIVMKAAPGLAPRTWYGMPAYAKDGKVVCFFQGAAKFQGAVRHDRLQRQGQPRRRQHVGDRVRTDEADEGRREADRRARQAGGELTLGPAGFRPREPAAAALAPARDRRR